MRARLLPWAAATGAVIALVAGCSGGPAPSPASSSGGVPASSAGTGKTLPYAGAPKVDSPLPDSALSGHPCDSGLTPDQLGRILNQKPQGVHDDEAALGAQCHWKNSDAGAIVSVLYSTKTADGLSAVYANTKPKSTVWRPLSPVQGFPAVAHSTYSAEGSKSFCQVSVGVSDQHTVDVSITLGKAKVGKTDPCDVTAQVADMVVTNLKQKAGA
ncbi:DUF3558 domain-containing protein [Amycolatopsis sp. VS8301801F10]|uniref:DUF3558 domain-containing protein n=1 Tax=Amycolatopsis sp. VS8301801F10 TaxID=2652442 RepID=UPI0038FCC2DE